MSRWGGRALAVALALAAWAPWADAQLPLNPLWVPRDKRGNILHERSGFHDAARIRTVFYNFGMVGDYPPDPLNVDLSVFHSAEAPKGSGMNYTDGITPFVLARVPQADSSIGYVMETGYRERQGRSFWNENRIMRFEPRPGYAQDDPTVNRALSPAISNDPRTWPDFWPDRDASWAGAWNGYFGKKPAADQESYFVMDDDYFDSPIPGWSFHPDSTDAFLTNPAFTQADSLRRHGLGLRIEVRGFQWANPQAGNVIFWHYDIFNEGTTDYDDDIIFGLYMDSGVGGSAQGCDPVPESDDDNAFFDRSLGLNLVYTWDRYGHGIDLAGTCDKTGYLGYAYMETPGNAFDHIDNDGDGITDENRDSTVVDSTMAIKGQDAIRAYVTSHYDLAKFEAFYGPLENRPAYKAGVWFPTDEDMDWVAEFDDVGEDGVPETHDHGEGDLAPTYGEPDVDKTDLDESDQIGLTGFKMNRIRPPLDNIWFFWDANRWPEYLYNYFTNPDFGARFDTALVENNNIAFFFASGPFQLKAGKHERFSLALAYGADLNELRSTVRTVQQIYNANYRFAEPPPMPKVTAEAGDGQVRLSWTDASERGVDPVTHQYDFEGYRIYRSTDPEFRDPQVISTGTGSGPMPGNGRPIAQFDLADGKSGFSRKTVDGVAYWLGDDSGIRHTWVDTTATNGQDYFYAVTAYDFGFDPGVDSLAYYPSENAIAVSRTPRGGTILPENVVEVRPEPRVQGFVRAAVDTAVHAGPGTGTVRIDVVNSNLVPDGHGYKLVFLAPPDSIRAMTYALVDTTAEPDTVLFSSGADFAGQGIGPVADGLLPIVTTGEVPVLDPSSGWAPGSQTTADLLVYYRNPFVSPNWRRTGYPDDITVAFSDAVQDTGLAIAPVEEPTPAKFTVTAHTAQGDVRLPFVFLDADRDGTLSTIYDYIDILAPAPVPPDSQLSWHLQLVNTTFPLARKPGAGDVYELHVTRPLGAGDEFVFGTRGQHVDAAAAAAGLQEDPYVVPNPYVGSASFEPARFAVSGRGERRLEFRAIPQGATVRIYTVRGDLVRSLYQDGSLAGAVAWDLRTKDNLDVAPGLYIFHVESPGGATHVGKFAILK